MEKIKIRKQDIFLDLIPLSDIMQEEKEEKPPKKVKKK